MSRAEASATFGPIGQGRSAATVPTQRAVALATDGIVLNEVFLPLIPSAGPAGTIRPSDVGAAGSLRQTDAGRAGTLKPNDPEE